VVKEKLLRPFCQENGLKIWCNGFLTLSEKRREKMTLHHLLRAVGFKLQKRHITGLVVTVTLHSFLVRDLNSMIDY
jgi:hypothetical protein